MNISGTESATGETEGHTHSSRSDAGAASSGRPWTRTAALLFVAVLLLLPAHPARGQVVFTNNSLSFSVLSSMISSGDHFIVYTTNGTVDFTKPIAISGESVTIWADDTNEIVLSGNNSVSNMFHVFKNSSLTLSNLAIGFGASLGAGGGTNTTAGSSGSNGGNGSTGTNGTTTAAGAAIYNAGTNILINCVIAGNVVAGGTGGSGGNGGSGDFGNGGNGGNAGGGGGSALGGAIFNATNGFLQLSNCFVYDNSAIAGSGGAGGAAGSGSSPDFNGDTGNGGSGGSALGAGIYNTGTCLLFNSTFATNVVSGGNSAAAGDDGSNGSNGGPGGSGLGGAVYNVGLLRVVDCTFVANVTAGGNGGNGGGTANDFDGGNGGNGGNGEGAGIYNVSTNAAFTNCTIINCTFSTNMVSAGTNGAAGNGAFPGNNGSPGEAGGGGLAVGGGKVVLANSILAYTTGGLNGLGTVIDAGHNISSDDFTSLNTAISRNSTNPELGTLTLIPGPSDYLGLTPTVPLLTNYPATNFAFTAGDPPIDQNGEPRTNGMYSICAGAFQYIPLQILTQPQNADVTVGASATFSVTASGYNPAYQWFFADTGGPVNNETNDELVIDDAQPSQSGATYDVVISDYSGSETSYVATLTVESNALPPDLIGATLGNNATSFTFAFQAASNQTYTIQYKDSLTNPVWLNLTTNNGTNGLLIITYPIGSNAMRFFRVLAE